jgi:hypothetical protein
MVQYLPIPKSRSLLLYTYRPMACVRLLTTFFALAFGTQFTHIGLEVTIKIRLHKFYLLPNFYKKWHTRSITNTQNIKVRPNTISYATEIGRRNESVNIEGAKKRRSNTADKMTKTGQYETSMKLLDFADYFKCTETNINRFKVTWDNGPAFVCY